ncbi:Na(+)/H(+) antiporter subunit D [Hyphobacterium sp. SN044]|uniref:Na(+)/H(+) antiporter subunit D n=1 Tax=Hyphobacterium sp. SN044 TaxID=2912575 RepID=UPI001F2BF273|nr:Na(+)/H(+) antiporter subunit D [Hyphobacterium sp. SN044]MCF8879238.1 Na(+)/H(+) antiporter subunit D [Hyphobacterium sp. SN044]
MIDLLSGLSPAWPVLIAGVLCAVMPWHYARKALMILAPLAAGLFWFLTPQTGVFGVFEAAGFTFETYRFDPLSRIWGLVFILAAFLNGLYALHERDRMSDTAALLYTGAGIGAVFAGDFLTLFFFWELTAITSVFLVWAGRNPSAFRAGHRYLAIHVLSGVLLLGGAILYANHSGSWQFNAVDVNAPGGLLILLAFGIKAAFPLLHNWLQDAYPKSTAVGAVVLSAFTTKLAIYALARGFAGLEPLIWVGAIMTAFPVFYAVIENDLRKVLAYSLNNQLGFMVAGIGVGTALGLNGAAAHAFVHIIYKGLLFMTMGAVLMRTGSTKATDLGGLYKSMPLTALFCLIGAGAISAFPLMSGFVAKALTISAVAQSGQTIPFLILVFASAGVLEHSGIKIPYFAFFAHDAKKRVKEAPANMLLAMGLAAFLCIYLGVNYGALYDLLPFSMEAYQPYSLDHIVGQMQLLLAALFAFTFLVRFKLYPAEVPGVNLDTDWFYRKAGNNFVRWSWKMFDRMMGALGHVRGRIRARLGDRLFNVFSPAGAFSRDIPSGLLAIWTSVLLGIVLLIAYLA